ncbi:uncharacterized protein LOC117343993 [Pecten maximus]|uniref:uncharacterized protein LOC117343993 n=1 Tax=Pecten maximus TaxID=6579 RepID=UPI001458EF13|nr:uncharacterized protein LOC117343993 [Pecten maximus]
MNVCRFYFQLRWLSLIITFFNVLHLHLVWTCDFFSMQLTSLFTPRIIMKLAFILVLVLPLVMSAPQKKAVNPFVNSLLNIFHADELKQLVTDLVDDIGSDDREGECEKECNHLVDTQFSGTVNILSHTVCPLACHSLQELAHFFHVPTPMSTASV